MRILKEKEGKMIIPKSPQQSQDVATHYDDLDPLYRQFWGDHLHHGYWETGSETQEEAVKNLVHLVAQVASLKNGDRVCDRVCDVGCGYGATARMLVDQWGADVTGITLSETQYRYATHMKSDSGSPRYLLQDWLANKLPAASFDVVLSIESSEHMEDKPRFFSECRRVLAPKGRLVVCAWIAKEKAARLEERYLLEPICREGRLPSMGTSSEYQKWMHEAGFADIQSQDISKQVRKTWALCGARILKGMATDKHFRKVLRDKAFKDRVFALTVFRLLLAYYTGSMRYIVFSGKLP